MKTILLAAAAIIAVPAVAQTTSTPPTAGMETGAAQSPTSTTTDPSMGQTAPQQMSTDQMAQPDATTDMQTQPQTDTTTDMQTQSTTDPMPSDQQSTTTGSVNSGVATDPAGGYSPSQPAISGTPAPGQTVTYQPAASPSQAFPPPAAMESYPICKKGQYDKCRQAGSSSTSKRRSRR